MINMGKLEIIWGLGVEMKLKQRDKDIIVLGGLFCISMIIIRISFWGGGWW